MSLEVNSFPDPNEECFVSRIQIGQGPDAAPDPLPYHGFLDTAPTHWTLGISLEEKALEFLLDIFSTLQHAIILL